MTFPALSNEFLLNGSSSQRKSAHGAGPDTYNEIDDQFALVYALLCPEKLNVEAVYAAPFTNDRSTGPGDRMEKSYEEILRLLERLHMDAEGFVYRGSTDYLSRGKPPQRSAAVDDLIRRAVAAPDDDPLYVVAIGRLPM